ncbi:MAG: AAA family ATPase [Alphaproteobacteria bacterium]|nr:AAA family ATPase [Alphaproteobacteria bacterium]
MSSPKIGVGPPPGAAARSEKLQAVVDELNKMVGLSAVKFELNRFISFARVMVERRERDLPTTAINMHMVFAGPPGTGKTVVARKVGRMLRAIRLLQRGHCIEVDRSHLVAPYVGQTAPKVSEIVDRALDGVLFIDEAYTLTNQGPERDPFGQEAVDTLLKLMEDNRERLVIIVAGYGEQMHEFVASNPGLKSRFSRFIEFQSYNKEELTAIFQSIAKDNGIIFDDAAMRTAQIHIGTMARAAGEKFGNARDVRGFFEKVVTSQAERLSEIEDLQTLSPEQLQTVSGDDVQHAIDSLHS